MRSASILTHCTHCRSICRWRVYLLTILIADQYAAGEYAHSLYSLQINMRSASILTLYTHCRSICGRRVYSLSILLADQYAVGECALSCPPDAAAVGPMGHHEGAEPSTQRTSATSVARGDTMPGTVGCIPEANECGEFSPHTPFIE